MRELPSRFSLPLLGDTLSFLADPAGLLIERTKDLGPVFRIKVLGDDVACFVGPEAFDVFLDERYFSRADATPPHARKIFGEGAVPFLAGEPFKRRKALLMKAFTTEALDGYLPDVERAMTRYARRWKELGHFAWVPELISLSMTIAGSLFLARSPEQDDPAFEADVFATMDGITGVPVDLPFTRFGKALRARQRIVKVVDVAATKREAAPTHDALSRLIEARTDTGEKLSGDEIRLETFHFIFAYVAVWGGLSMLAMHLGAHPEVKEKLRAEIREKCPSGPITVARIRAMPYLARVTKESRRCDPVFAQTFFATVTQDATFKDVRIAKGMKAIGCIAPTVGDGRVYAEPARFDPDRWLGARAGEKQEKAWVPHGGGTHLDHHRCAGEHLASLMLAVFSVLMLRDYDWELPEQDLAVTKDKLVATPASGLPVHFTRLNVT